jgi:hypothetical protein
MPPEYITTALLYCSAVLLSVLQEVKKKKKKKGMKEDS